MNCGLGSLLAIKTAILPSGSQSRTDWDDILQRIGKGVASAFDTLSNRGLARAADAITEARAPASSIVAYRYPLESLTSIELQQSADAAWRDITDSLSTMHAAAGLVHLGEPQGSEGDILRITYDGGFWFDTSEDPEEPDEIPEGATGLPDALKLAWLTQIQDHVERLGLLKHGALRAVDAAKEKLALADMGILPGVREVLNQYRRYS